MYELPKKTEIEKIRDERNEIKKKFLDLLFNNCSLTRKEIAAMAGASSLTMGKFLLEDPDFLVEVRKVEAIRDGMRADAVEDKLFSRLMKGEAKDIAYFFYLNNHKPVKYQDRRNIDISGEIKFINHIPEPEIINDRINSN